MAGPECNNADEDERGQAIRNATMQRRTSARHVCKRRRGHRRGMCENVDAITEVPQRNNAEELIGGPRGRGSWAIIGVPPCTAWKQSSRMSNARGVEANRRGCVEEVGVVVIVVEVIIVVVGAVGMNGWALFSLPSFAFTSLPSFVARAGPLNQPPVFFTAIISTT
eukprot:CAMPEP_0179852700 /NCGR_PEP_ID=MMETSP0982-20121206/8944_1 /TAXON_ID=483367 /ORGANISM="non described non described, Strain CCMP 2436" /LENGTH=165 /DNA_ID=CAMNT_0021738345 /DNA_START=270 /DNA_END=764 /DNA_ORIENTATION=+